MNSLGFNFEHSRGVTWKSGNIQFLTFLLCLCGRAQQSVNSAFLNFVHGGGGGKNGKSFLRKVKAGSIYPSLRDSKFVHLIQLLLEPQNGLVFPTLLVERSRNLIFDLKANFFPVLFPLEKAGVCS